MIKRKQNLPKARNYLKQLDNKIKQARSAKKINKIAELKEIKRRELRRAKRLKEEIAKLEKGKVPAPRPKAEVIPKPEPKPKPEVKKAKPETKGKEGLQAGGGLVGGSVLLSIGYLRPMKQDIDLVFDAGLGLGNQFSVITAGVS